MSTLRSAFECLLDDISHRCGQSNWDGDNSDPILPVTCDHALRLIEALPADVGHPDITPEPDGHILLEWYHSPARVLAVSISSEGVLYWSGLDDAVRETGAVKFDQNIPTNLLNWIRRI